MGGNTGNAVLRDEDTAIKDRRKSLPMPIKCLSPQFCLNWASLLFLARRKPRALANRLGREQLAVAAQRLLCSISKQRISIPRISEVTKSSFVYMAELSLGQELQQRFM